MGRIVRIVSPVLALTLLLAGCTLTVRPGHTTATVYGSGVLIWGHLDMRFAFPGLVVVEQRSEPHRFDAVIRTDDSLHGVYYSVDQRMRDHGWFRRSYTVSWDRIRAEYVRGYEVATVIVSREGYPDRYRVVIYD